MKRVIASVGILLGMAVTSASAQVRTTTCAAPADSLRVADDTTFRPAIRIEAEVTARELRFDYVGSPEVTFQPCTPRSLVRVERINLPERLQPGVTYRDVGVRLLIQTDFALACQLAAALGIPADTTRINSSTGSGCPPGVVATPADSTAPPRSAP